MSSPESRCLFAGFARRGLDPTVLLPWDETVHAGYDVAFTVGPTTFCPVAPAQVLLAFGPPELQTQADWAAVVATCTRSRKLLMKRFGPGCRYFSQASPMLELNAGSKQLLAKPDMPWVYAGPDSPPYTGTQPTNQARFSLWSRWQAPLFSSREFNSQVRAGAAGVYPLPGCDVQIRRHLALGGGVVCSDADLAALGAAKDLAVPMSAWRPIQQPPRPDKPVLVGPTADEWVDFLVHLIGKL